MHRLAFVHALALLGAFALVRPAAAEPVIGASAFPEVNWRLVGPYRGGWTPMAVGVPTEPDTYYSAAAGGGLWKTTDSGRTWAPVTDSVPITGVGAVAVAPSNPKVLYVGSGHPEPRYDVIAGSGVYRSDDAGATWRPLGLAATRHIGRILVDPRNADVVLVAALGHVFGPNPERGVYLSEDGGRTWNQTLSVDDSTGAVDLAADPDDPRTVYASTWTARVYPWLSYFTPMVRGARSTSRATAATRGRGSAARAGPPGRSGASASRSRAPAARRACTRASRRRSGAASTARTTAAGTGRRSAMPAWSPSGT